MDPFEKPYWSKLQVELWICTGSREAVALAQHAPGRTRLADTSIGSDGWDHDAYDQDTPIFGNEIELIGTAITNYGFVCQFDDARKEVIVALSKGQLREHPDCSSGVEFFEREEVLRLWPDPRLETLRAKAEPLTVAEAMALLVPGCPVSKDAWRLMRRRNRGRFPEAIQQGIEEAGRAVVEMIRRHDVEAWGRPCARDQSTGRMAPTGGMVAITAHGGFLAESLWVDPCEDAIWTEPAVGDDFNREDRGYRDVVLNRAQFLGAITARRDFVSHEHGVSLGSVDAVIDLSDEGTRPAPVDSPREPRLH